MKKALSILLSIMMVTLALAGCGSSAGGGSAAAGGDSEYPAKDINGIIMWGEGGGTDNPGKTAVHSSRYSPGRKQHHLSE